MREADRFDTLDLGHESPIFDGPIALDRHAATRRWLTATTLLGVAAGLLVSGALGTATRRGRRVAAPNIVHRRLPEQSVAEGGRGDPVLAARREAHDGAAVRIERLNDSGSVRPFTRVAARLAQIDLDPRPAEPATNEAPGGYGPALPPIILYGGARPKETPSVSAYAAEEPSLTSRARLETTNVIAIPRVPATKDVERRVVVARQGDTLEAILTALGATHPDARAIVAALSERADFNDPPLEGGEVVTVLEQRAAPGAPSGPLHKIRLERPTGATLSAARTDAGAYRPVVAETETAALRLDLDARPRSGATLRDSLHALARLHHVEEAAVAQLLQLCGRDFDLDRTLGADDEAELLYAPNELDLPELAFVALTAQGRSRRYYRFTAPDDGGSDFYDGDGRSATKFLLRKPVLAGRLGDGFGWRIHPVLHDRRFHEGVDYAAPYGSPIAAAGEGVVEGVSEQWGYGKYIRIRHDLGYETTYAHVAGFPRGLKVGDRVRQGETIAFVGSTGLSTGPHLYYEVRINGRNVDPLTIHLAAGRVLQGKPLDEFQRSARELEDLARAPGIAEADAESPYGDISR